MRIDKMLHIITYKSLYKTTFREKIFKSYRICREGGEDCPESCDANSHQQVDRPPGHAQKVRLALMVIKANVQIWLLSMPSPYRELSGLKYLLIKIFFEAGPDQVCLPLLLIGRLSPKKCYDHT